MSEIFISTDIEADGPIPGDYSMLSLGAAALTPDGKVISTFYVNLETLPGAMTDQSTMDWWAGNKEAYEATRKDTVDPKTAMEQYTTWVKKQPGVPVFVGYPAGYDFTWVYWYLIHFTGSSPFSFSGIDIKTYASAILKLPYRQSTKKNMPKRWFPNDPHTHIAVEDAIEQGKLFCNMLKENLGK
jgi:hypothetical protein